MVASDVPSDQAAPGARDAALRGELHRLIDGLEADALPSFVALVRAYLAGRRAPRRARTSSTNPRRTPP